MNCNGAAMKCCEFKRQPNGAPADVAAGAAPHLSFVDGARGF